MTVIAQQKPDFSGDWTLNRQASTLSPAAAAFQSGVMCIDHREPVFRCQATYVADGKPFDTHSSFGRMVRDCAGTATCWCPRLTRRVRTVR